MIWILKVLFMSALGYRLRFRLLLPTLCAACALQLPSLPRICELSFPAGAAVGEFPLSTPAAAATGFLLITPGACGCQTELSALLFLGGFAAPAAVIYFLEARTRRNWLKARNTQKA